MQICILLLRNGRPAGEQNLAIFIIRISEFVGQSTPSLLVVLESENLVAGQRWAPQAHPQPSGQLVLHYDDSQGQNSRLLAGIRACSFRARE